MAKFKIQKTSAFKKSIKKLKHDKKALLEIEGVIDRLANDEKLEAKFKDHALIGSFKDFRECHIRPDLLLIYSKCDNLLILTCVNVGSHSDLFKM